MSIAWKQLEEWEFLYVLFWVDHPQTKRGAKHLLVELDFVVLGLEDVGTLFHKKSPCLGPSCEI